MHRFIPSRLQLSYPSLRPWFTEACGEAVVLKQLAFASWKANPTEGNLSSFHEARNKCVSTLRRARKQHLSHLKPKLSNLSPSSKSWWCQITFVSLLCSPSIPSLTSNGSTADTTREKAECLNSAVWWERSCLLIILPRTVGRGVKAHLHLCFLLCLLTTPKNRLYI